MSAPLEILPNTTQTCKNVPLQIPLTTIIKKKPHNKPLAIDAGLKNQLKQK